jgi:hypothetical protein
MKAGESEIANPPPTSLKCTIANCFCEDSKCVVDPSATLPCPNAKRLAPAFDYDGRLGILSQPIPSRASKPRVSYLASGDYNQGTGGAGRKSALPAAARVYPRVSYMHHLTYLYRHPPIRTTRQSEPTHHHHRPACIKAHQTSAQNDATPAATIHALSAYRISTTSTST